MILHVEVSEWFWLVVSILATWRLTSFLHYEEGPFRLFAALRRGLGPLRLRCLVECFHCAAFWIAAAVVVLMYEPAVAWVLLVVAVAGGASIIEIAIGKGEGPPAEEAGQPASDDTSPKEV